MELTTADEVYEQVVKPLSVAERLRLVEKIARGLTGDAGEPGVRERYDWARIRGIAPGLMGGEDAQEWVSRTRRESDEERERGLRREP